MTPSSADPIRRWCAARDPRARTEAVIAYQPLVDSILASVARNLPSHVDRDDLRACGMLALLLALDDYSPERGAAFATYARPRVRGAMIDHLRRAAPLGRSRTMYPPHAGMAAAEMVASDDDPARMCVEDDEHERLYAALLCLDERERTIVTLRHMKSWSLRRIAAHINLSESRVSRLHSRALRRLSDALA